MDIVLCLTTCPDRESADTLARALVEEHLAACVGVLPGVTSFYRWQGEMEEADEWQLFIKTTRTRLPALESCLTALHPHEVPEFLVLDVVGGLPAYLAWVDASVRVADPSESPP